MQSHNNHKQQDEYTSVDDYIRNNRAQVGAIKRIVEVAFQSMYSRTFLETIPDALLQSMKEKLTKETLKGVEKEFAAEQIAVALAEAFSEYGDHDYEMHRWVISDQCMHATAVKAASILLKEATHATSR